MSDKTGIEWTDATWNPVTGCAKVSAGCKHCYAEREWQRMDEPLLYRCGKKRAGRLLDGVQHDGYPKGGVA